MLLLNYLILISLNINSLYFFTMYLDIIGIIKEYFVYLLKNLSFKLIKSCIMTYLRIFFKILLLFSLPAILLSQDVTLRTQADVDAFDPSITVIIGNLKIDGAGISDPIKDLSNLSNLTSITEDLDISHNIALTKLDGLNSITSIGNNLIILSNAALVNLDGLSNLSSIVSDLSIFQNYALINLTGLSNITSIGGGLTISSNTTLPNLDGLNNITSIGGTLKLSSNPALINLTGLSNITSIGRDLDIYYNNALTNLTGLNSLTSINHDLIIANNATLTNLNGLNNLTSIGGGLIVQYNAALTSFEGLNLSNITSMGLDLYIYYNNALTNLDGLNNITSIGGKLFIDNNDALTNIDGLNNLSSVGRDLDIKYNKALTNIEGLNNLSSVGGDLEVYSNPSLTDCCGIQNLLDTPGAIVGQIRIYNNPSECNSKEEILDTPCGININIQTFAPCINANNGMIQVTVSGYDTIPFFYSWDRTEDGASGYGSSLDDVFSIKNLSEGTYNITVITNRPDTAIKIGIVLEQIPGSIFEIIGITTVNSSNGFSNGSITVKTAGGTAPFSYEWSGVSSGSKTGVSDDNYTMPNLAQGEYFITLSDDAGNMQEVAVSLLDETVPVFPCTEPLDIVILNDVSGSVDATEYSESKQFFVNFLEEVNIGQDADESRAAIIEWSSSGQQEVKIDITGDIDALKDYINYNRSFSGGTSPHQAMEYGKNYLDSIDRADVEKVLILSTDGSNGQVSPSLIALADKFKADGYHIVTIAFDNAFANNYTRDILTKVASNQLLAPGAPAYSLLDKDLAKNIVNLYLCPIDPGSTATAYFNRDGAIDIIDIIPNGNCPYPNGVEIKFTLEALRELSLPAGTPVTFYYNNPELFGATSVFTWVMPCALPAGAIDTFSVVLPVYSPGNIFAVLNDDGSQSPPIQFPITDIEELAYSNNIDNQRICADGNAILQAIKYTTTPKPICDTLVLYTINVCNISEIDAFGVTVNDLPPAGFVLTGTTFNDNGCALDNGDNYDIPAGCCISLTLTYDASKAENGYYRNQGVDIDGPSNQEYIDFDGSNTTAEDVIIDGSIDCPSTTVEFSKEVNVDESCDDAFVVYTFTINNEMNIPLQGLVFTDILPSSCTWAFEPYLLQGLNIGSVDIKDNTATFTIDEVQANTVATFQMDAALGLWDADGTLSNTATIENVPDPDNGGYKKIYSNSVSTDIIASPTVSIPDTIYVSASSKGIKLDAVIN
ncbi:MAG TPA: VWA domain-containing protein, partial [Bacteroidetes bacterium]|nr:VWA domain-containing protein [Bacteroidota bacterium]